MTRISLLKPTTSLIWVVVALSVGGGFLYANHSTTAARFGAKPVVETSSALKHVPAATGVDSSAELLW